eukprot:2386226-Heterocapsa_arctica.AAC.1
MPYIALQAGIATPAPSLPPPSPLCLPSVCHAVCPSSLQYVSEYKWLSGPSTCWEQMYTLACDLYQARRVVLAQV